MNQFEGAKAWKKGSPNPEKLPSLSAAELRARNEASEEKETQRKKEATDRAETKRVEKLWLAAEAKKTGPHVIAEKAAAEAEELARKHRKN